MNKGIMSPNQTKISKPESKVNSGQSTQNTKPSPNLSIKNKIMEQVTQFNSD